MRPGLAIFVLAQLSALAGDDAKSPPVPIVADPVETYYREHLVADGMDQEFGGLRTFLQTVEADFDCDGRPDLAVTSCFEARAKAGTWSRWWGTA